MRKLNVAVIGCGSWGENQIRVFSDQPESSLVAIADIDEKRARGIGES